MHSFYIASVLMIALVICGCAGTSDGLVGKAAVFPNLPDLDDNEVFLGSLLQDRVDTEVRGSRKNSKVDSPSYLLLVNSHSGCDITSGFMKDLLEVWDGFIEADCRCALVIQEKPGAPAEVWKEFSRPGISLFRDPEGMCLELYAQDQIPAMTLIDHAGFVVFHCEGYVAPGTLLKKIRNNDFSSMKTEAG